jgi:hypothetical protein
MRNKSLLYWGLRPQTPGVYRFYGPEWASKQGTLARPLPPFRLLSRSLGLLSSIALSRPAQLCPVSIHTALHAMLLQPTVYCQIRPCLTNGATPGVAAAAF